MTTIPTWQEVLLFWFGQLDGDGAADEAHAKGWWRKDPEFDALIREKFLEEHRAVVAGKRREWLATPRGRLAAIIVLDQFSRNMFRGTSKMFEHDELAVGMTLDGLKRGDDGTLVRDERVFFSMPLMHSEDIAHQERSVEVFAALAARFGGRTAANAKFAVQHRDIVARFGRFPHRNEILGRPSTPDELEFLKQPGSSF